MPGWNFCIKVLVTSALIIVGANFIKEIAIHLTDYVNTHSTTLEVLTTMSVILMGVTAMSKRHYLKIKNFLYSHREVLGASISYYLKINNFLYSQREVLGASTSISSYFYASWSFYLSFYNFEKSIATLYAAFGFMAVSVAVMYGRKGVPSSTIVMRASHASLILASLGMIMMIMPNMMNAAFVIAFTATFSLVVSTVLFVMSTMRSEIVFYHTLSTSGNVENKVEEEAVGTSPDNIDDVDKDVFLDTDEVPKFVASETKQVESNTEQLESTSNDTFHTPRPPKSDEINNNETFESAAREMIEDIISDLTEQAKSIENCANYLITNEKNAKLSTASPENESGQRTLVHRRILCHECRCKATAKNTL